MVKPDFQLGQTVDLAKWGKGKIAKLHCSRDSGRLMVMTVHVKPRTKMDEFFAKDGFVDEMVSPEELEWTGDGWAYTESAVKDRKHSDRHGGV